MGSLRTNTKPLEFHQQSIKPICDLSYAQLFSPNSIQIVSEKTKIAVDVSKPARGPVSSSYAELPVLPEDVYLKGP